MTIERRFVEFRADGDTLSGVAVRYGDTARIAGQFDESIQPGAFTPIDDVILNLQHERSKPVARTGTPYLSLDDDDKRLEVRATLPDTVYGREARELIDAGLLRGLSVEMTVDRDEWRGQSRVIHKARLSGVGLVDRQAYPASQLNRGAMPVRYGAVIALDERRAAADLAGAIVWDTVGILSVQARTAVRFAEDSLDLADSVALLHGSDYEKILASSGGSDTLRIAKSQRGIEWQAKRLARTQAAKDVNALLRNKLISGFKPGYVATKSSVSETEIMGLPFQLESVETAMLCELRLTSDSTGGIGRVGRRNRYV